jgi:succinylarginine dihydrolase
VKLTELQIDRLVGPTHHFGGLGVGNLASQASTGHLSNPAAAALQSLDKMRVVAGLGVPQLVLAPHDRPDIGFLRALGFGGRDQQVLQRAFDEAPELLSAATSCSAMWTANAATVTPIVDSVKDVNANDPSRVNLTTANLNASIHRAIEPPQTAAELFAVFGEVARIHAPLPGGMALRDEGAANHLRLGSDQVAAGINIFVYGDGSPPPNKHWPRQSRAACQAVARLHRLLPENTFFIKQHPAAIDGGAFHNDVVAMSHQGVLIHHEHAFVDDAATFARIDQRFKQLTGRDLVRLTVSESMLPLAAAVATYLFNSQIVSSPGLSSPTIICTTHVQRHPAARALIQTWCDHGIFSDVVYVDLDQSMSGGGGPACLRLRVQLPEYQASQWTRSRWTESIDQQLRELIVREYPDRLQLSELARADFCQHAQQIVQQLKKILSRPGSPHR